MAQRGSLPMLLVCVFIAHFVKAYDFDDRDKYLAPAASWDEWHETMQRASNEYPLFEACVADKSKCSPKMKSLRHLIERGRTLDPAKQLTLVNYYVNRLRRYSRDRRYYKEYDDYRLLVKQKWSTLLEFLDRGGDCEDYATAKYVMLRLLGFESDDLRIVIVYDRNTREYHAVIAVTHIDVGVRLLDTDNRIYRRRPAAYRYVYAINEDSIWDHSLDRVRKPRKLKKL